MDQANAPRGWGINGFCAAYDISKSMYYKLDEIGFAPEHIYIGSKRIITAKAADRWEEKVAKIGRDDWRKLFRKASAPGAA